MSLTTLEDFSLDTIVVQSDPTGYYTRGEWSNSKLTDYIKSKTGGFRIRIGEKAATMGRLLHTWSFESHLLAQELEQARKVLSLKEINLVKGMAQAIRQHRTFLQFMNCGEAEFEKEAFFQMHGLNWKMKADAVVMPFIGDAKSTACKTYEEFLQSCVDYGYFRQANIYKHGLGAEHFYIWGVTKKEPFQVFFVNTANEPHLMAEAAREIEHWCSIIKAEEAGLLNPEAGSVALTDFIL